MSAIEKVAEAFFSDPKFKNLLELKDLVEKYAKMNQVYPRRQIVSRLDAFYMPENGDIKFIEFNCDSPSGMGWHDVMVDMFKELPTMKKAGETFKLEADKFLDTHTKMLLKKYQEFCKAKGETPVSDPMFAIVCASDSTILSDVKVIVDTLAQKGHKAIYADPRDFAYDGKHVTKDGQIVHVIYRDAVQEFLDEPYYGHTDAVLKAYEDGNICFVNPFCSRVGGLKSVLAIMHDERFSYLFTEEELEVIKKYIPFTRLVRDLETDYHGEKVNILDLIKNNREKLVLKPNSGYGGHGVMVGPAVTDEEWKDTLKTAMSPGNTYVVQEMVPIPFDEFPVVDEGKFLGFQPKNVNINFWAYDGEFGGAYVRAASGAIINVHQGGGMVPVFYVS
jgi:glutathionylspermidine synthase